MIEKVIWLIDENENESRTYARRLKRLMPTGILIKRIFPPYRTKKEYIDILDDPSTACIVVDQRMKGTGEVTYSGIELAQYLRSINKKIPIYILTSFADEEHEFTGGEWSVDDIVDKGMLKDEEKAFIIKARILRRIDVHEDLLNKRAQRFSDLLKKSLSNVLDETELQELTELQFERTASTLASELAEQQALDQIIKTNQQLLDILS
ncbi:response regulator [Anaerolineales bacterium HSG6]|nr:response regulator [Anaerolineales bacterium HSG6]